MPVPAQVMTAKPKITMGCNPTFCYDKTISQSQEKHLAYSAHPPAVLDASAVSVLFNLWKDDASLLLSLRFAFAEPFGIGAFFTDGRVVFQTSGDGFSLRSFFVLQDEPFTRLDDWNNKPFGILFHGQLLRCGAISGHSSERLLIHRDGFHVFIQHGDVKFVALHDDFTMRGFVLTELYNSTPIRAKFDAFMSEAERGDEAEEEECFFHGFWGWVWM